MKAKNVKIFHTNLRQEKNVQYLFTRPMQGKLPFIWPVEYLCNLKMAKYFLINLPVYWSVSIYITLSDCTK